MRAPLRVRPIVAALLALPLLMPRLAQADAANTAAVVNAVANFKASVTAAQQAYIDSDPSVSTLNSSCQYNFKLANVEVWSNLPVGTTANSVTRNGLIFSGLSTSQLSLVDTLASTALSTTGKKLMDDIRAADRYISGEVTNDRGTTSTMWGYKKYFVAFVGAPSTSTPWTLQIGGHHMAFNITYNGTYTSATPLFAGNEPNSWTDSTGTYAPLGVQRGILVNGTTGLRQTLTSTAALTGTFSDVVFGANGSGPGTTQSHDTIQPKAYPTTGRGQLYSALSSTQQGQVRAFIESVVNDMPSSIASELLAIYESPQALAETYVGYGGTSTTMATSGSYFRVDGPRVWIEFSTQGGVYNPQGIHDHFLWRDKLADYGASYGSTTISTTVRPPTITTQPASQTVNSGTSVTFSVVAASAGSGTATLTYQWYKDGAAISGATSSSYTISSAVSGDAGSYAVRVISTGGLVYSSAATLTVSSTAALAISSTSPLTQATRGVAFSQTLAATGGTPNYSWTVVSGALPSGLTLSSVGVISGTPTVSGTFTFTAQVSDSGSSTATKQFTITVIEPVAAFLATYFPNSESGAGDDYDLDGFANAIEFVLGGNPTVASQGIAPTVAYSGGSLVYSFSVVANLGGVTWLVETSNDLSTWTPVVNGANGATITSTPSGSVNLITVTVPTGGAETFTRLRVGGY